MDKSRGAEVFTSSYCASTEQTAITLFCTCQVPGIGYVFVANIVQCSASSSRSSWPDCFAQVLGPAIERPVVLLLHNIFLLKVRCQMTWLASFSLLCVVLPLSPTPINSTLSSVYKSASQAILSRMQLTVHATRRTPHGASRLVPAMSAWSVKTRRACSVLAL